MNKEKLISTIKLYLLKQIEGIASSNPLIAFTKPIITRVLDNKISSLSPFLDLLKDNQGNIDLTSIITEMTTSVMDTKTFSISVPIIGDITIGNGHIKLPIPYTDQVIVLNRQDIEELKEMLTNNIE
jgi:hypothetical protein